jgi:hypothetical protein
MPARGHLSLLILLAASGCAAARSDCMRPVTAALPLTAPPDAALVVFVRHEGAKRTLYTVMDEQMRFLGESPAGSWFTATLPPGEHVFVAWDNRGPDPNGFTFEVMGVATDAPDLPGVEPLRATLSRGRVYVVVVGPNGTLRARAPADEEATLANGAAYAPDIEKGQALLGQSPMRVERIRKKALEQLEGYRSSDVALHTLHAKDGR